MIYDAHCHLDLMDNMLEFINEIQNSDMNLFAVGTTPKAYSREIQFCKNARNIHVGLGMHPQLVSSGYDDMQLFKSLIEKSHYIGEVGLDFSKGYIQTKELQINIFSKIVKLCEQYSEKVISIHSLKSTSTVIEILRTYKRQKSNKYIFHWFTGSVSERKLAIDNGAYFSINPKMLETKAGKDVIRNIPADRILLETDAPFTLKCNSMEDLYNELERIAREICYIRNEDVISQIEDNSMRIF